MFSDKFLDTLPADPKAALLNMMTFVLDGHDDPYPNEEKPLRVCDYVDSLIAIRALIEVAGLPYKTPDLDVYGEPEEITIQRVTGFCRDCLYTVKKDVHLAKFKIRFGSSLVYHFSDDDVKRIQDLINELRDLIADSTLFDEPHKKRLLAKLEILQAEMHKDLTSLAKFWDLIPEAGIILGKFGNDAKPLVDRIVEIGRVLWGVQTRAEQLPPATPCPLLPAAEPSSDGHVE